jgi:hypothetical protein
MSGDYTGPYGLTSARRAVCRQAVAHTARPGTWSVAGTQAHVYKPNLVYPKFRVRYYINY